MRKNIGIKVLLMLAGLLAVVFYEITIPIINAVIHLKINILGFFLEPLLQWAFNIPLRQAQIVSAWVYLFAASLIFWYLFYKFYKALLVASYTIRRSWLAISRWRKMGISLLIMLLFLVIGKTVLMFI